jgi:hypothetical protein
VTGCIIITDTCTKATNAYYGIKSLFSTSGNVSRKLSMITFDKQISQILTYGSSIWDQCKSDVLKLDFKMCPVVNKIIVADTLQIILNREIEFNFVRLERERN